MCWVCKVQLIIIIFPEACERVDDGREHSGKSRYITMPLYGQSGSYFGTEGVLFMVCYFWGSMSLFV